MADGAPGKPGIETAGTNRLDGSPEIRTVETLVLVLGSGLILTLSLTPRADTKGYTQIRGATDWFGVVDRFHSGVYI